jgi:hypothetical protein
MDKKALEIFFLTRFFEELTLSYTEKHRVTQRLFSVALCVTRDFLCVKIFFLTFFLQVKLLLK